MSVQIKGVGTIGGIDQGLDTVGVVTATSFVGTGVSVVGVITATSFVGSGANLTGLTIPGGATNLDLVDSSGTGNGRIRLGASQDLQIYHDGSHSWFKNTEGRLILQTDGDQIQLRGNTIKFFNGAASTEYLRIDSSGRLLIGTATEGQGNADELTLSPINTGVSGGDQGRCGMTIRSGDNTSGVTQNGYIYFSDGTSGGNEYRGVVAYQHSNDSMYFSSAGTSRMRILSDGRVLINTDDGAAFQSRKLTISDVTSGGTTAVEIRSATNGSGRLYFTDSTSSGNAGSYAGKVFYDHNTDHMGFYTGGGTNTPGERMKIDAYGNVTKPDNAAFHVTGTAAGISVSANSNVKLPYNTETGSSGYFDNGAHYDTGNYRFTAPVAGKYFFYASMLNFPSSHSSYFTLVGSINGSRDYSYGFARVNSENSQSDINFSTLVSLNANDYFEIQMETAGGSNYNYYISGGHGHFFGFLVQ